MTSREVIPANRDSSKANAAHRSELETRADELRAIAAKCKTINEFARELSWSMEVSRHAREVLGLDLPDAKLRAGKPTVGQAVPKPTKRAGK